LELHNGEIVNKICPGAPPSCTLDQWLTMLSVQQAIISYLKWEMAIMSWQMFDTKQDLY
jgi:hypothetical protein